MGHPRKRLNEIGTHFFDPDVTAMAYTTDTQFRRFRRLRARVFKFNRLRIDLPTNIIVIACQREKLLSLVAFTQETK